MAITKEVTCAILRDWQSKKTTFEEKSVEYTEIRQKISHTDVNIGARPLVLNCKRKMNKI